MVEIRANQKKLPKERRYKIGDLLARIGLKRSSYYDECERMANPYDKYVEIKKIIMEVAKSYIVRGRYTAGYRRIQKKLDARGVHLAGETIRKLMNQLKIQVEIYNQNRNGKYSSYRGTVGKTADNLLKQKFDETKPYKVIHTDITQTRLANQQKVYLSVMIDEATKEVLACQISDHPNRELITNTLEELLQNLPDNVRPIIHSDQGWHYQLPYYTQKLADHHFIQSMSRKANCLDNAPVESFFHLLKTELLNGRPLIRNIEEFKRLVNGYINFFNNIRISLKTDGLSPVEYRNEQLAA